jgi:hypothetical protein
MHFNLISQICKLFCSSVCRMILATVLELLHSSNGWAFFRCFWCSCFHQQTNIVWLLAKICYVLPGQWDLFSSLQMTGMKWSVFMLVAEFRQLLFNCWFSGLSFYSICTCLVSSVICCSICLLTLPCTSLYYYHASKMKCIIFQPRLLMSRIKHIKVQISSLLFTSTV